MVLKWTEGAELWGSTTHWSQAYLSHSGVGPATPGRTSPGARYITSNTGHMTTPSLGVDNTWIIGFGLYLGAADWEWRFLNGASEQLKLEAVTSGGGFDLRITRGATTIATSSEVLAFNVWHYIELKVTLTNTGSYELRVNEQNVLSDAGPVDLQELGSSGADGHSWFHNGGTTNRMDDIYILDGTGTVNNDFRGDSVMYHLKPNGDGTAIDWSIEPTTPTTHYDKVDDDPTNPSSTDYVYTNTNTDEEFYDYENNPATGVGTIFGVKYSIGARMAAAGSSTLRTKFYDGTSMTANGDDIVVDGTSVAHTPVFFDQNPVTASTWTKTDIDNGQFGFERIS